MRTRIFAGLVASVLTASLPVKGQTTGGQGTNQATPMQQTPAGAAPGVIAAPLPEREFNATAVIANRYEIQTAELALSRADDAKLKEFARMMLADHNKALNELEAAAQEAGVAIPSGSALDQTRATKLASLEARMSLGEFDPAYRADQIEAHQRTLTMLETYQRIGAKEPLRVWAANTATVVRKHLEMLNGMK